MKIAYLIFTMIMCFCIGMSVQTILNGNIIMGVTSFTLSIVGLILDVVQLLKRE